MKSFMVRELTPDEIKREFILHMWDNIDYWSSDELGAKDVRSRLEGLMHSTLALIDGCNIDTPGYTLTPFTSMDDMDFYFKEGYTRIYPIQTDNIKNDIGGGLHEVMYPYKREYDAGLKCKLNIIPWIDKIE